MTNDENLIGHNFVMEEWSFLHWCIDLCHLIRDWQRHATFAQ
jgi:hypothetical protein